ncbi:MAG: Gfo/Idh/MocA family oxidoreductase [Thermosphaera sp.]
MELAQKLGADKVIMLQSDNKAEIAYRVQKFTNNNGIDVAIVTAATKSSVPVNLALEILRSRGKVVVVGDVGMKANRDLMYRKEASIIVSRSYGPGRYDPVYEVKGIDYPIDYVRWTLNRNMQFFLELLKNGKVQMKPLISKVVSLNEAPQVYEEIVKGKANYMGIVISYEYQKYLNGQLRNKIYLAQVRTPEEAVSTPRRVSGKVRLGIIGAGNFVTNVILPILLKDLSSLYEVVAISTKHPNTCKDIATKAEAKYCTTNYKEILEDKNVDAVLIATPHNTHARIVIDALKAGKAVFVEKPIAINEKEPDEIFEVYKYNPLPITVDFNRRFSPFMYLLKDSITSDTPIYGIYRVNAGFIPLNHWIQDPEIGGGRIVGEVCHFVDFFNALLRIPAEEVVVSAIPVDNRAVIARDNISTTIKWRNGSLTTIHYASIGSPLLPKEYVELYTEGKTIIIENFTKMSIFEKNDVRTIKLPKQDKGHKNHLIEFAKLIKGEKSDIPPFEEYLYSMKLTFEIEKRLRRTQL